MTPADYLAAWAPKIREEIANLEKHGIPVSHIGACLIIRHPEGDSGVLTGRLGVVGSFIYTELRSRGDIGLSTATYTETLSRLNWGTAAPSGSIPVVIVAPSDAGGVTVHHLAAITKPMLS